ncbi:DUF2484 family protein [Cochlodiniinecator piscidefendens]|uniref:DUF2484 family protein n=1 Tax=Cochlodiniinecator piscidefendens TaxID=2715756 RepID=UPI00140B6C13|nr:DUF2484 family protein [Cochlodiniinecator piscidefendens]
MNGLIVWASLWVLAATVTAFLPMRFQFAPGLALLLVSPVLVFLLAQAFGLWAAVAAVCAVVSMFRRPLVYYGRKWIGRLPVKGEQP